MKVFTILLELVIVSHLSPKVSGRFSEAEKERGARARATGTDKLAPLGRGRGKRVRGGGEKTAADRLSPPVRRHKRGRARPR
jgi:hypothetical protein